VLLPDRLCACSAAFLVLAVRAAPAPLVALRGPRKSAVPVVPFVQKLTAGPRVQRVAAGAGGVVEQLLHGDRHHDDADTVLGDQLPVLQLAFPDDRLGLGRLDQRRPPVVRGLDLVPGPEQHADNGAGSCTAGGNGWINGNIIFDRDVFGDGDFGDWGVSLFEDGIGFGVAVGSSGNTICGATGVDDVNASSTGAAPVITAAHTRTVARLRAR